MARVVLTAADGLPLVDKEVPDAIVMQTAVGLIEAHPDLPIYIEGELLLPEQRAALIHQAEALRQAKLRIKEDMTPEEFRRNAATLRECYEDLRRLHFSSARELGLLVQAHNAAVVEEGIRARFYLHQSLEDIDAIDTSATVARVRRRVEAPDARSFAPITVTADAQRRVFGERGKQNRRKQ